MYSTLHLLTLLVFLGLANFNIYLSYDSSSQNPNHSRRNNIEETMFRFIDDIESHFNQVHCSASTTAEVSKCLSSNRRYNIHVHMAVQISMWHREMNHENNTSHQHEIHGDVDAQIIKHCLELWDVAKLVNALRSFHMRCNGPRKVTGGVSTVMYRPKEGRLPTKMTVDESLLMFSFVLFMLVFNLCLKVLGVIPCVGQNDDEDNEQTNEELYGSYVSPYEENETSELFNSGTDIEEESGVINNGDEDDSGVVGNEVNGDEYAFSEDIGDESFTEEDEALENVVEEGVGSNQQINERHVDEAQLNEVENDSSLVDVEVTELNTFVELYGSPTVRELYSALLRDESMFPKRPTDSLRCPICIDDFIESSEAVTLRCGHKHHCDCLLKWIDEGNAICPICRKDI